jgi:uncharacterized membrane protein YbjE (DUF340 family)
MSQLVLILTLMAALAAGIILGRIPAVHAFRKTRAFDAVRSAVLFALIFAMGFHLGRTEEILGSIASVGIAAAAFALASIAGTVLVLAAIFSLRPRHGAPGGRNAESGGSALKALKDPLILLVILAAGFLSALLLPIYPGADADMLITAILYVLLLAMGIGLGGSGVRFSKAIAHPDLFLIPLGTAAGSLLGGLAAGFALGIRAGTALAVSSGFGWYSLSGVMLTELDGPITGSIAFLANIMRESAALLLIPILARTRFPYIAIGAGGATAMDVTLPLIEKSCGPGSVGFSMASGAILSLAVPVLVPLFHQLGR